MGNRTGFDILPPGYVCDRCGKEGHLIKNCPTNGDPKYDRKRVDKGKPKTSVISSLKVQIEDKLIVAENFRPSKQLDKLG